MDDAIDATRTGGFTMPAHDATPARAPIGVYDSGVGGLSVLPAIRELLPADDLIYIADAGHLPYGEKSPFYVVERAWRISDYFVSRGVKAIAIPCNTATAAAAAVLRDKHADLPIIGIEPAVKPAARLTRSGVIGVLATTGTLLSAKFQQLVRREAPGRQVLLKACPGWVDLVEQGASREDARRIVFEPVDELLAQGADVLVLGCTHFPFLVDVVRERVGPDFPVLETGLPFALELRRQLLAREPAAGGQAAAGGAPLRDAAPSHGRVEMLTSGDPAIVQLRVDRLMPGLAPVARLPDSCC
ncbi:glutamate racemase [Pigmentiphaga litoralis]|uniref:glutamate racemase n=1 Tax=Pigmentiphaga litoralis TaxID=516702 RepID=UPI003B43D477